MVRKITALVLFCVLCITLVLSLGSCSEERPAHALMAEFCASYGIRSAIYSPSAREGEVGYVADGFFAELYGEGEEWAEDYAVVLLSDLGRASECAVFICYTDFDAGQVTDMLHRRIELIRSICAVSGLAFPEGAFVYREGRAVVMCALDRPENAKKLWREIL